jgi:hypothetical protein
MTIDKVLEKWDDAVQIKITHDPYWMTKEKLMYIAAQSQAKAVFIRIWKTSSLMILSRKAAQEEARQQSI